MKWGILNLAAIAAGNSFGQATTTQTLDEKLCEAAAQGNPGEVEALLKKGANPNASTKEYPNPLFHLGSNWALQMRIIKLLIAAGTNWKAVNNEGQGLLHTNSHNTGNIDLMKVLLELGLDPNGKDKNGITPIFVAAEESPQELKRVELLLKFGADPTIKTKWGESARSSFNKRAFSWIREFSNDPDSTRRNGLSHRAANMMNPTYLALNPGAAPLEQLPMEVGPDGYWFPPFSCDSFEVNRRVRFEGGKAIVTLEFKNPSKGATRTMTLTGAFLRYADAFTKFPIFVTVGPLARKRVVLEFPAPKEGIDAVMTLFRETTESERGAIGDSMITLPYFYLETNNSVKVGDELPVGICFLNMGAHVRIVEMKQHGKILSRFSGEEFENLTYNTSRTLIPGLTARNGKNEIEITFEYRFSPNLTWRRTTIRV